MSNHNHDPSQLEDTSHLHSGAPTSTVPSTSVAINTVAADSNLTADCDFHRHSEVNTYQIPCSTHHSDSGSYLIRLDEPVTVFEDFRIKIKAKSGVLTKKIGQCWLNTFFILLDDGDPAWNCSSNATNANATGVPLAPTTSTSDCCSTSDSNSGSGSSSDSSPSTASSTSSSVRNSPPHFAGVNEEDEDIYAEEEGLDAEGVHDHKSLVEDDVDEEDGDELPILTSNSATLNPTSPVPQNFTPTPQPTEMLRRSSNPLQLGSSKVASGPAIGASGAAPMPFISIPKKDSTATNFAKKVCYYILPMS